MRRSHMLVVAAALFGLHGCGEAGPQADLESRALNTCALEPTAYQRMACFETWDFQLGQDQQDWTASVVEGFGLDVEVSTDEARWQVAYSCFVEPDFCPLVVDLDDDWSSVGDVHNDPPDPGNSTDCAALARLIELSTNVCKARSDEADAACTADETSDACEKAMNAFHLCLEWQDALIDKYFDDCVVPSP